MTGKSMKHLKFLVLIFYFVIGTASAQLRTFYVTPNETDSAYESPSDSNYVAINLSSTPVNKLLFYIGGTQSSPRRTTYFLDQAANLGYHAFSITYPNSTSIQTACGSSSDTTCYENFRQEACYGTPLSASINIDTLNSLYTRAIKLLQYLDLQYPNQNWAQFLDGNSLQWTNIVTAGHSQGAGHALYFAQVNNIDRCIMFSGANDYSNFYSRPANWLSNSFATAKSDIYSFLHLQDEGMPQSYDQFEILDSIGMFTLYDTVLVDNIMPPYNNSNLLYTNEVPRSMLIAPYHNATVVDFWTPLDNSNTPLFTPVWDYLLTSSNITTTSEPELPKKTTVYPNPATNILYLESDYVGDLIFYNSVGMVVKIVYIDSGIHSLNITDLSQGVYFIKMGDNVKKILKR